MAWEDVSGNRRRTATKVQKTVSSSTDHKRKAAIALGAALMLSCLIVAGFYFVLHQAKKVSLFAVNEMADVIAASAISLDSIKELGSADENAPVSLSFFTYELTWLAGKRINLNGRLIRDMKFALNSGVRVKAPNSGYEIIPKKDLIAVVTANQDLFTLISINDWLLWSGIIIALGLILFAITYFLLRPDSQLDKCKLLLGRLADNGKDDLDLDTLLLKAKARIDHMEQQLFHLSAERTRLQEEVKTLQRSLRKTTQDLEATQENLLRAGTLSALGEFAAGISHELNNPMGIVLGFTQHLLDEVPEDHPHYPKLRRMEIELGRCQRILQDLLAFARPLEPAFKWVDVNKIIKETVQFVFYPGIEGIDVTCNLEEDLPEIEVDPEQLEQILINLIKNAIQAIEQQGTITVSTSSVTLTREDTVMLTAPVIQPGALLMEDPGSALSLRVPRIEGAIEPGDPGVKIEISDTGGGISPQDFQRIFTPFYTTKKDGTGLGLSICWKLVRRNRGILKVASSPGKGSRFSIIFPVKEKKDHGKQ